MSIEDQMSAEELAKARAAAEMIRDSVVGMRDVGSDHAERSHAYENQATAKSYGADAYDAMLTKSVAQEKAMEQTIEHEQGHER
jgi:hypothetical protein